MVKQILAAALMATALSGCVADGYAPAPYYGGTAPYYGTAYAPAYVGIGISGGDYYRHYPYQHIHGPYNNGYWHYQHAVANGGYHGGGGHPAGGGGHGGGGGHH